MFSLIEKKVFLNHANPRAEQHGSDHVLAMDLKISVDIGNDTLREFHPRLKEALYWHDSGKDGERDLADQAREGEDGYRPDLMFPDLGPLAWKHELVGARVILHAPISKNDIEFEGCIVDRFVLEPKEGGSVTTTFRVIVKPDEKQSGRILSMIQSEVDISIVPAGNE